ncbi:uncharacterized protein LOC111326018 [Stylophora pistillata]|uniref:uncharacterized protein LOC111326018 n=1 Tax=Stylophora pistillata TaxID=50429 RepID=UPI000C0489B1|nr:uncharacterized protein LOC111326018 [Stylophora pistillata]
MATMDEKLQKARMNIDELEGGIIFSVIKNEIKTEESQSEPQIFNGKDYFDLQPSWFDTLSNNFGCLKVDNSPVTAPDLEAMKNFKSNLKLSTKAAKGKDYFDRQPSWFDTLSTKNGGCLKVKNFPVRAKDLEAMKSFKSNSNPSKASDKGEISNLEGTYTGGRDDMKHVDFKRLRKGFYSLFEAPSYLVVGM